MKSNFGIRLKTLRNDRGLTQHQLGNILGFKHSTISDWETGKKDDPLYSSLRKISRFFGVSIDYLTGDTDVQHELMEKFNTLNKENQKLLLEYAEFLRGKQDNE